jgi:hypothetical protein
VSKASKGLAGLKAAIAKDPGAFRAAMVCLGCGEKSPLGMCAECRKVMAAPGTTDEERGRGPSMPGLDSREKRVAAAFMVPAIMNALGIKTVHVNGVPFTRNEMLGNMARVMWDEYGAPKKAEKK